jgi:hypothetical protein
MHIFSYQHNGFSSITRVNIALQLLGAQGSSYWLCASWTIMLLSPFCCFIITFIKQQRRGKKISKNEDEADFCTFTRGKTEPHTWVQEHRI